MRKLNPKADKLIGQIRKAGRKPESFFARLRNIRRRTSPKVKQQILADRTAMSGVIKAIAEITNKGCSNVATKTALYVEMRQHLNAKEAMGRFVDTEGVNNEEILPIILAERLLSPTE